MASFLLRADGSFELSTACGVSHGHYSLKEETELRVTDLSKPACTDANALALERALRDLLDDTLISYTIRRRTLGLLGFESFSFLYAHAE